MRRPGLFAISFVALLGAGCAGVPLYQAPPAPHAMLKAVNRLGAGDAGQPDRVALFKVDGVRLSKLKGTPATAVTPGTHRIELFADHNGVLRFATLRGNFAAGAVYTLAVTPGQGAPYRVTVSRDGGAVVTHLDF